MSAVSSGSRTASVALSTHVRLASTGVARRPAPAPTFVVTANVATQLNVRSASRVSVSLLVTRAPVKSVMVMVRASLVARIPAKRDASTVHVSTLAEVGRVKLASAASVRGFAQRARTARVRSDHLQPAIERTAGFFDSGLVVRVEPLAIDRSIREWLSRKSAYVSELNNQQVLDRYLVR